MSTTNITKLVLERVEKLLLEGRLEDVKAKYPEPMWDQIDALSSIDPSGNNKYLEWLAKTMLPRTIKWFKDNASTSSGRWYSWTVDQVPDQSQDPRWADTYSLRNNFMTISNTDLLQVQDDIEYFHKNPSKYEKKDINQFANLKELEDATNEAKLKLSRKEQKDTGVDKVFEDDDFLLLMPKTHKASCRYGSNTRWCVTMRGYSGYFENYFSQGPIFFLVDKRRLEPTNSMDTPNYYKIAIHYRPFNGRLDNGGRAAMTYVKSKTKEEFVNGANADQTQIDYWNVADDKKPEKTILKFLGGPGRGQTKKGNEALAKLKDVMQSYTRKALSDYYDSFEGTSEIMEKIRTKQEELSELQDKNRLLYEKISRLETVYNSFVNFAYRVSREEGDDDEFSWVDEQKDKAERYLNSYKLKKNEIVEKQRQKDAEINQLESKINDKKLVFYDKEKNVPMVR